MYNIDLVPKSNLQNKVQSGEVQFLSVSLPLCSLPSITGNHFINIHHLYFHCILLNIIPMDLIFTILYTLFPPCSFHLTIYPKDYYVAQRQNTFLLTDIQCPIVWMYHSFKQAQTDGQWVCFQPFTVSVNNHVMHIFIFLPVYLQDNFLEVGLLNERPI